MDQQEQGATDRDREAGAEPHYPAGIGIFQAWAFGLIGLTAVMFVLAVIVGLVLRPGSL